jgi:FAD-dependent urate hydroxylase
LQNLKVIIIGAGIGGLTAGIALRQAGFEVKIFDKVQTLRPVGAGISLWSNGVKVLNRLGLGTQIAKIGGRMERMQYRNQSGELLNQIPLQPLIESVGQRPYPVARADLQQLLLDGYDAPVHLGCQCVRVDQDEEGVTAHFADGSYAHADLLVAADGIHSLLREHVLGKPCAPQYQGYVNWNGLVPAHPDLAPADTWVIYVGNHQRASLMPVGNDRFYFFFDVPLPIGTPNQPGTYRAELTAHFAGWAEPVQKLIASFNPHQVARVEIRDLGPLSQMARGRVALLGDSAHATCPDLGQGGCQAMEDGLVLSQYLQTTNVGVADALRRYAADREERTRAVVLKARARAAMIHGEEPQLTQKWYQQLANEHPSDVTTAIANIIVAGPLK